MQDLYTLSRLSLNRIKIESNYIRGLPCFTVLNFGTTASKELSLKLRSALSATGYKWSLKKQAVFSYDSGSIKLKKSSELELSLILRFLIDSEQSVVKTNKKIVACGEVSLHGEIKELKIENMKPKEDELWIGNFLTDDLPSGVLKVTNLKDISLIKEIIKPSRRDVINQAILKNDCNSSSKRKPTNEVNFTKNKSPSFSFIELLSLYGGFSKINLLNKSRVDNINECFDLDLFNKNYESILRVTAFDTLSSTKEKIQISKKNLVLIDDYSLLDKKQVSYINQSESKNLLWSNTQICPCGKAELGKQKKCGFSLYRCRSVLEKLSLSMLDSFYLFECKKADQKILSGEKLNMFLKTLENINLKKDFKNKTSKSQNLEDLILQIHPDYRSVAFLSRGLGEKRLIKVLMVARSIADLFGHDFIEHEDLDLSYKYSYFPLKELVSLF